MTRRSSKARSASKTSRARSRSSRRRTAVLEVAGDLLAEHGFARLDLAEVAARAEVGKTTVYRR
ncbi:TetR family transcriptional regulator, partial [Nocardia cyriacigeorgica]|uniref:TetR family transcriptional regulator n=1 Tax=Nocardia cyriacigeorgica TaxID=135487 RepID=UPI00245574B6